MCCLVFGSNNLVLYRPYALLGILLHLKAIKSDFFHYDKQGVNVTLAASLNQCAARENASKLGASLHSVIGKGDWKWRVEYLRPRRYYARAGSSGSQEGLCARCLAGKDTWLDVVHELTIGRRSKPPGLLLMALPFP